MTSTSNTSDGAVVQGSHVKEQLHKLSFQIVQHTNILRSIMNMEVLEKVGADWSGSDQVRLDSLQSLFILTMSAPRKKGALRFRIESTLYHFFLLTTYFLLIVDL